MTGIPPGWPMRRRNAHALNPHLARDSPRTGPSACHRSCTPAQSPPAQNRQGGAAWPLAVGDRARHGQAEHAKASLAAWAGSRMQPRAPRSSNTGGCEGAASWSGVSMAMRVIPIASRQWLRGACISKERQGRPGGTDRMSAVAATVRQSSVLGSWSWPGLDRARAWGRQGTVTAGLVDRLWVDAGRDARATPPPQAFRRQAGGGTDPLTVGGIPGLAYLGTAKLYGSAVHVTVVMVFHGRTSYTITCTSTRAKARAVHRGCAEVLRTFKVTKPSRHA
jgi:hypothetical protein